MPLPKNLREVRLSKGVSLSAVAEVLGMTPSAYGHIEKARNHVPEGALPLIAEYLGVPEHVLLDDKKAADYVKSFNARINWLKSIHRSKKNSRKAQ